MINREATIRWKGYDPDNLKPKSSKKVWCNCDKCGKGRWLKKSNYKNLCKSCARMGIKYSNETLNKMSDAKKGKKLSQEHKNKISKSNKNPSDKIRKNRSDGQKGRKQTEYSKNLVRLARLGTKMSDKTKKKLSKINKGKILKDQIVGHHIAYDFKRPKALVVKITRSFHIGLHKSNIDDTLPGYNKRRSCYSLID